MNYGRALKIGRAMVGLEQRDLAELAHLDPSHISLIEQGKRNPTVATLEKIARALNIPYHILTLLASESKDLRNVNSQEINQLGKLLAKTLLSEKDVHPTRRRKSRIRRRPES